MITIADEPYQELHVDLSRLAPRLPPGEHRLMTIPAGCQGFVEGGGVLVTRPGVRVCVAESRHPDAVHLDVFTDRADPLAVCERPSHG